MENTGRLHSFTTALVVSYLMTHQNSSLVSETFFEGLQAGRRCGKVWLLDHLIYQYINCFFDLFLQPADFYISQKIFLNHFDSDNQQSKFSYQIDFRNQ